jgi:phage tail protein X
VRPPDVVSLMAARVYGRFEGIMDFFKIAYDVNGVRPPDVVSLMAARVYGRFEGIMDFF